MIPDNFHGYGHIFINYAHICISCEYNKNFIPVVMYAYVKIEIIDNEKNQSVIRLDQHVVFRWFERNTLKSHILYLCMRHHESKINRLNIMTIIQRYIQ